MEAQIVVGLQFGDEGKGRVVDYLLSTQEKDKKKIVVRFSGGQQAGHTVVVNGIKHVFSNLGSGGLRGIPTYFSEHTTIYLNTLIEEKRILAKKKILKSELFVHPLAKLTTPYDVAYNRINFKNLSDGTCGLGVGSTMERNFQTPYKLFAIDLLHPKILKEKLKSIKNYYIEKIERKFGNKKINDKDYKIIFNEIANAELVDYLNAINVIPFKIKDYKILLKYETIVFEGSQGIMLDMDHGIFPNVTYANTTSKNAIEICDKLDIKKRQVIYVTRTYQTRHGNGWMSNNNSVKLISNENETNKFNGFQGYFKVSELDYDILKYALEIDSIYSSFIPKTLFVTCNDQRKDFEFNISKLDYYFTSVIFSYGEENITENIKFV